MNPLMAEWTPGRGQRLWRGTGLERLATAVCPGRVDLVPTMLCLCFPAAIGEQISPTASFHHDVLPRLMVKAV